MARGQLAIVLYTTALAYCALYAPQPLLPLLSAEFAVSPERAGLLISLAMLPLSLAPVIYGFILEAFSALQLLKIVLPLLALSELPFLWTDNFSVLLAVRLLQGLLLPAVLTALTTYLSSVSRPQRVREKMAYYIAATLLGGLLGRLLTGAMATWSDWRYSFAVIALGLLSAQILLYRLQADSPLRLVRPTVASLRRVLLHPHYSKIYGIIFLVFFCFSSLLNLLPFRLEALNPQVSSFAISLSYMGYFSGLLMALSAQRVAGRCGGEVQAIALGLVIYALAMLLFWLPGFYLAFATMFVFCAGMFLVHTTLNGYLNHHATQNKGLANGLYITASYAGGSLGAYLPGGLYQYYGWSAYLLLCLSLIGLAFMIALRLPVGWSRRA